MQIAEASCFIVISILLLRISKKWAWPLLAVYLGVVFYLTLWIRNPTAEGFYSFELGSALREALEFNGGVIKGLLTGDVSITKWSSLEGVILNVLMFVPVGYLVPSVSAKVNKWWKVLLIGFLFSLLIEFVQLYTHLGYAEIDDLVNNTIGAVLGWIFYLNFMVIPGKVKQPHAADDLKPITLSKTFHFEGDGDKQP